MKLNLRGFAVFLRGGVRVAVAAAVLSASLVPLRAFAYPSFDSDSKHNFVEHGFTGGGVCDECHAAGGGAGDGKRLFNWNLSGVDQGMCVTTCHSGTFWPVVNGEAGWAGVSGVVPPVSPHSTIVGRCEPCHNRHTPSDPDDSSAPLAPQHVVGETGAIYRYCLDCHKDSVGSNPIKIFFSGINEKLGRSPTGQSDSGTIAQPEQVAISSFMGGTMLSRHNFIYNTSGNLALASDNECLKCHGTAAATDHPGVDANSPILAYPDDPDGAGPLVRGSGIISPHLSSPPAMSSANWDAYYLAKRQTFCLSCHDGRVDQSGSLITLNGAAVPAVPARNYNSGGPSYTTGIPYFADTGEANFALNNYFEGNGHGRGQDFRGAAMNLTCLGEEPRQAESDNGGTTGITVGTGCHSVHGTANAKIIRDAAGNGSVDLGSGVNTAEGLARDICLGCHDRAAMRSRPAGFHLWMGSAAADRMIHLDGTCDTVGTNSSVLYRKLPSASATRPGNNMETGEPLTVEPNLPFFASRNEPLATARIYDVPNFDGTDCVASAGSTAGSAINCITCHDPHGTFKVYQQADPDTPSIPFTTYGMVRRPTIGIDYDDPLCGQCHIEPP